MSYSACTRQGHPPPAGALPAPDILAASIVEDLQAALEQFAVIAGDLKSTANGD